MKSMCARSLFWLLVLTLSACATVEPEFTSDAGQEAPATEATVNALTTTSVLTAAENRMLLSLGSENGWDLYVTPGVPGANEAIKALIVSMPGVGIPSAAIARISTDAWKTSKDIAGTTVKIEGRKAFRFLLGGHAAGKQLQMAFRLTFSGTDIWLSAQDKNYKVDIKADAALKWAGDVATVQDGLTRQIPGDVAYRFHPLTVRVDTWPETPKVDAVLHYTTNDFQKLTSVPMTLDAVKVGATGDHSRWIATLPATALATGAKLVFWVEAKTASSSAFASLDGKNYTATLATPPAVSFAKVGKYSFSKQSGWSFESTLDNPFVSIPSSYMPPSMPAVELYVAGVTDRADAGNIALGGFVRVEVWSPFFSGSLVDGRWMDWRLGFQEQKGSNWRMSWPVRSHGAPFSPPNGVIHIVNGMPYAPAGDYPYKFRITSDNGQTWQWLGTGALPWGGDNRTLTWTNQEYPPQLTVAGTPTWGKTLLNVASVHKIELVNTTNDTLAMSSIALNNPNGVFAVKVVGCTALSPCTKTLKPGARLTMNVTFKPKVKGLATAAVTLQLQATTSPYLKGPYTVGFEGTGY